MEWQIILLLATTVATASSYVDAAGARLSTALGASPCPHEATHCTYDANNHLIGIQFGSATRNVTTALLAPAPGSNAAVVAYPYLVHLTMNGCPLDAYSPGVDRPFLPPAVLNVSPLLSTFEFDAIPVPLNFTRSFFVGLAAGVQLTLIVSNAIADVNFAVGCFGLITGDAPNPVSIDLTLLPVTFQNLRFDPFAALHLTHFGLFVSAPGNGVIAPAVSLPDTDTVWFSAAPSGFGVQTLLLRSIVLNGDQCEMLSTPNAVPLSVFSLDVTRVAPDVSFQFFTHAFIPKFLARLGDEEFPPLLKFNLQLYGMCSVKPYYLPNNTFAGASGLVSLTLDEVQFDPHTNLANTAPQVFDSLINLKQLTLGIIANSFQPNTRFFSSLPNAQYFYFTAYAGTAGPEHYPSVQFAQNAFASNGALLVVSMGGAFAALPDLYGDVTQFTVHDNSVLPSFTSTRALFSNVAQTLQSVTFANLPTITQLPTYFSQSYPSLAAIAITGCVNLPSLQLPFFKPLTSLKTIDFSGDSALLCAYIDELKATLPAHVHIITDGPCAGAPMPTIMPHTLQLWSGSVQVGCSPTGGGGGGGGGAATGTTCVMPTTNTYGALDLSMTFNATGMSYTTELMSVTIGGYLGLKYDCALRPNDTVINAPDESGDISGTIACTVPAGCGYDLGFVLAVSLDRVMLRSNLSLDRISYPPPQIFPDSLRRSRANETYTVLPAAPQNFGAESISFDGINLFGSLEPGLNDSLRVFIWYGLNSANQFPCPLVSIENVELQTLAVRITCTTQADGFGQMLSFGISVGGQIANGTDVYTYASQPVIASTRGCSASRSTPGATECPTNAGAMSLRVTIFGTGLFAPLLILVKGAVCAMPEYVFNGTAVSCNLPDGTGQAVPVLIFQNGVQSQVVDPSVNLVSYAAPAVTRLEVSGTNCTQYGTSLVDCPRNATTLIGGHPIILTVHGTNFGADRAQVLVGAAVCHNPVHDSVSPHTLIRCTLPPGGTVGQTVVVIAYAGDPSSATDPVTPPPSISYVFCGPGLAPSLSASGGFLPQCLVCGPATANNMSTTCNPCDRGTFSNQSGMAVCWPCPVGTYAATQGATACDRCFGTQYQLQPRSIECDDCGGGYFLLRSDGVPIPAGTIPCSSDCPPFTTCGPGGITADADYWLTRQSDGSIKSFACLPGLCIAGSSEACQDELKRSNSTDMGEGGYHGMYTCCGTNRVPANHNPLCGRCEDGFTEWRGECIVCDGTNGGLVFAVILLAWLYVLVLHATSQSSDPKTQILFYAVQMIYIFLSPYNTQFLSALSIFSVDFIHSTPHCIAPIGPLTTLGLQLVIPVLCFVLLAVTRFLNYAALHARRRFCSSEALTDPAAGLYVFRYTESAFHAAVSHLRVSYTRTACGLFLFSYTQLSGTSLAFVQCTSAGDQFSSVVRSAPAIVCHDSEYNGVAPLFYTVLVCCAGAPIALGVWLKWNERRVSTAAEDAASVDFRARFGTVLFSVYRPDCYWYSVVILLRRFALGISVAVLLDAPVMMFSVVTVFNILSVVAHVLLLPYASLLDNRLELAALTGLSLLTAAFTSVKVPLSNQVLILFGVFVIAPITLFACWLCARFMRRTCGCDQPLHDLAFKLDDESADASASAFNSLNRSERAPSAHVPPPPPLATPLAAPAVASPPAVLPAAVGGYALLNDR